MLFGFLLAQIKSNVYEKEDWRGSKFRPWWLLKSEGDME